MKIGQVLSTVDFTAIPEGEREEFKQTLATLRDDVPPLPFKRDARSCSRTSSASPLERRLRATSSDEAFAAASIGQVHRAVTHDGRAVAVKVQYPGVAEAVETDLRNLQVLLPLVKRLAPGLDVKALAAELRERIARGARLRDRGAEPPRRRARLARPPVRATSRAVDTTLSTPPRARHRVASRAGASRRSSSSPRPSATASPRSSSASSTARSSHLRRAAGDPHPGNYLLLDDGRVGFLDFGLMRVVDADYLELRARARAAVVAGDAGGRARRARRARLPPRPATRSTPSASWPRSRPPASGTSRPASAGSRPRYVADLMERGSLAALGLLRGDAPARRSRRRRC